MTAADGLERRMKDPKMKGCAVQISYRADDGFSAKDRYSSKPGASPGDCLAMAADELARIAELFGFGDQVEAAVKDARQRVRDWRTKKEKAA
jgi:hypothetical protein